jgi:outer membrane protein
MSRLALLPLLAALAPAALAAQDTLAPSVAIPLSIPRPSVAPLDTTARPISLDEAVRLARRNSPLAVQARGQERTSRAQVRAAYASFLPSVTVGMGQTHNVGTRFDDIRQEFVPSEYTTYGNQLFAQVELFDGGRRLFEAKQARENVGAADANATLQDFNVAFNVKQQYYAVLAAREADAAARTQLQQAQQQLRAAAARVAAGAATKSDSLRSVIQVGNARLALITAENQLRVANATLTRLVATPFTVTADPADTVDAPDQMLDSATVARLAAVGPAVRQAEAQASAARAGVRAARTPYLPTISASFSRGGQGEDARYGFGNGMFQYANQTRLSLNFPIFDQWNRELRVAQATVADDNAEANLRDARLLAQQNLVQYLGAMRTAQERVAIQQASVAAAMEDLRVQQQRYALGASTLLDLLTSQTQLSQAQAALIQARYDYRVARAQLEALTGRDLAAGTPQ